MLLLAAQNKNGQQNESFFVRVHGEEVKKEQQPWRGDVNSQNQLSFNDITRKLASYLLEEVYNLLGGELPRVGYLQALADLPLLLQALAVIDWQQTEDGREAL
jgi:hypothetical protein